MNAVADVTLALHGGHTRGSKGWWEYRLSLCQAELDKARKELFQAIKTASNEEIAQAWLVMAREEQRVHWHEMQLDAA